MQFFNVQNGDCAWINCHKDCAVIRDQQGKLAGLPGCVDHKEFLTKMHQIYKGLSTFYVSDNGHLFHSEKKVKVLRHNISVLMTEIKQRLNFTCQIKEIYRDEGHQTYIQYLMDHTEELMHQLVEILPDENSNANALIVAQGSRGD